MAEQQLTDLTQRLALVPKLPPHLSGGLVVIHTTSLTHPVQTLDWPAHADKPKPIPVPIGARSRLLDEAIPIHIHVGARGVGTRLAVAV